MYLLGCVLAVLACPSLWELLELEMVVRGDSVVEHGSDSEGHLEPRNAVISIFVIVTPGVAGRLTSCLS